MTSMKETAALLTLLESRSRGESWSDVASAVSLQGDATSLLSERLTGDSLLPDPRLEELYLDFLARVDEWQESELAWTTVLDDDFPERLLGIVETPPFLFWEGTLDPHDSGVSVVGSRRMTDRGRVLAEFATHALIERGLSVLAGLARGIDTVAHSTAIALGGRTVAFLGTGIRGHYPPENLELQQTIADRGLVVSQFLPDAKPSKASFPMRNAVMSGYGLATIVIEAGEMSGTRIQARRAVAHGRPVILTDLVVSQTKWGAKMADLPTVQVVGSAWELDQAIDRVVKVDQDLDAALDLAYSEFSR